MKNVPQGHSLHSAFTMIELIFVIVILGVLSAIAIPKFASTKNMADISSARADVAVIRSAILTERQSQLIKGKNSYIGKLSSSTTTLFTGDTTQDPDRTLLTYGIIAGSSSTVAGKWTADGNTGLLYNFRADTISVLFTYDVGEGTFNCDRDDGDSGDICKKIVD
ncbi:Type II secretion envelope pseudopilin protein (PulG,guides folded protein to PulD in outer membrane) [hydrothermal vent metagenome]|uniref:Type II secretion envelope pseudopilin protein (PulG,guides folded protein to PulD in outer membrane) n=1 Tax=hydrothermal vent metagenome TaxID=652676 RepID=A0A1W1B9V9_9ZZZZ